MEHTTQEPYRDTPPTPNPATTKPLPPLPSAHPSDAAHQDQPYRDDPTQPLPTTTTAEPSTNYNHQPLPQPPRYTPQHITIPPPHPHYYPYTDTPPTPLDDDVPLAHLITTTQDPTSSPYFLSTIYPLDAPPSYSVAVRQAYRDTLIQYIPGPASGPNNIDEEAGLELELLGEDEVRHSVERVVAMFVVASLLLVISGVMGWLALGSGLFG